MSKTDEKTTVLERAKSEYIVDGDFHLHMPMDLLYEYIDDPMVREKLEEFGPPGNPTMGWKGGYATEIDTGDANAHMRAHGAATNREEIKEVMDEYGLDEAIVEPGTHMPFAGARYPVIKNALASAYNDYVLDEVVDIDEGILASVIVPNWDVEAGVRELERVGSEPAFVGAQNFYSPYKPWGATEFDPIFDKLEELELPLLLHPLGNTERFDLLSDSMRTYPEMLSWGLGKNMMANVVNMIFTGVFDKYPDLQVVMQEAGTNWIPYLAHRSDELYQVASQDVKLTERLYERDQDYLEKMPSEYIFENMWVTTQPIALPKNRSEVSAILEASHAEDMFIFSTDWPHTTLDMPNWIFDHPDIDQEFREQILYKNAEEVHRMPE